MSRLIGRPCGCANLSPHEDVCRVGKDIVTSACYACSSTGVPRLQAMAASRTDVRCRCARALGVDLPPNPAMRGA